MVSSCMLCWSMLKSTSTSLSYRPRPFRTRLHVSKTSLYHGTLKQCFGSGSVFDDLRDLDPYSENGSEFKFFKKKVLVSHLEDIPKVYFNWLLKKFFLYDSAVVQQICLKSRSGSVFRFQDHKH